MKRRLLAVFAVTGAITAAGIVLFHPVRAARVVAYYHDAPGSATIVVSGIPGAAFALSGEAVPAVLDAGTVNHAALARVWPHTLPVARKLARLKDSFTIRFPEDGAPPAKEQNHVVAFYPMGCSWLAAATVTALQGIGLCGTAGHLEIVRQSPAYLRANYGFEKPDGYSIAGRRTVALPQAAEDRSTEVVDGSGVPILQMPQLPRHVASGIGDRHRELRQAARLIAMMYERPLRVGPIAAGLPADADATARLAAIQDGRSAVQCQDFRDIWLQLAVRVPGIERVRPVSAYNYFPPFADLVTFSHALAEIYIRDENRWVLIDPWLGFSLRHEGRFLGVAELMALRRVDGAAIEIVPLVSEIRRFAVTGDESRSLRESPVAQIAPPLRSRFADGRYQFGYLDYFVSVTYGPEHRRAAPIASGAS